MSAGCLWGDRRTILDRESGCQRWKPSVYTLYWSWCDEMDGPDHPDRSSPRVSGVGTEGGENPPRTRRRNGRPISDSSLKQGSSTESGGLAAATVDPIHGKVRVLDPKPEHSATTGGSCPSRSGPRTISGLPVSSPDVRGRNGHSETSSARRELIGSMPAIRRTTHHRPGTPTGAAELIGPRTSLPACALIALLTSLFGSATTEAQYAVEVVEYVPGNAGAPFIDPTTALGAPTRMSGIPDVLPSTVTPFQPAFGAGEIVTIGRGGRLTVAFDQPVLDDPANPFGIDLLIFGNAFFTGSSSTAPCATGLYEEAAMIEVSADGIDFVEIPNLIADGAFPTSGYQDAEAYATEPGQLETDFLRPVDPGFLEFASELCWEEMRLAYDGSGGGVPIDLSSTGLAEIRFVRISTALEAPSLPEIDAFADVRPAADVIDADFDDDGRVDGADLTRLLSSWGSAASAYDLVEDGMIDGADLTRLLSEWSP